jgi:NADH dehydrogenase
VVLLEGADRVLPGMDPASSRRAHRDLERLGVEVRTDTYVTDVSDAGVRVGDEQLPAANVLWAAGVAASPLASSLGVALDDRGRVPVTDDLSIPGHPEAFVVGDLARVEDPRFPAGLPGVAQTAIQGGRFVARVIADEVAGHRRPDDRPRFRYRDKGSMATIGKNHAVAEVAGGHFGGWFAWLLWGVVHIMFLIGFRAKVAVMWNWIWNFLFYSKGARLITGSPRLQVTRVLREDEVAALESRH